MSWLNSDNVKRILLAMKTRVGDKPLEETSIKTKAGFQIAEESMVVHNVKSC